MPIDNRAIDPLRCARSELLLQRCLGCGILRKQHNAGRVSIDAVDDERLALSMRPQMLDDLVEDRGLLATLFQGHGQQPGGLVQDDERRIFVKNAKLARRERKDSAFRAAGSILPDADFIALFQTRSDFCASDLGAVHAFGTHMLKEG